MPSSYTPNLGIELPADGELDGVWGDVVNDNMEILDRAINGSVSLSLTGTSSTLTTSDGVLSDGQFKVLVLAGTPSGTHTITISPDDAQKIYFVRNTTAQSVVFTQGSGGNVTIATGDSAVIYSDGAGAGAAVVNITNDFAMNSVKITGGSIDGAAIGGSTAAAITGTTITATGDVTIPDKIIHAGDTNTSIRFPAADTVTVETDGAERLRVTSTGNVGIGTTSPATALDVNGDVTIPDKIIHAGDTNTSIRFPAADTVTVETNGAERLRVTSTGNVGIGTSSPGRRLDVVVPSGTTQIARFAENSTALPSLSIESTATGVGIFSGFNTGIVGSFDLLANGGASYLTLGANGSERMRIDSAGNVGIGTTSPTATLHVNGTVAGTFLADKATAEAGTSSTTLMTPQRTAEAIDAQAGALPTASTGAGQWTGINPATGAAAVLPAGGTWAYAIYRFSSGVAANSAFGVAAGGATIGAATAGQNWSGFAWRVQ